MSQLKEEGVNHRVDCVPQKVVDVKECVREPNVGGEGDSESRVFYGNMELKEVIE